MSREELRQLARYGIRFAARTIEKQGTLNMMCDLIDRQGEHHVFGCPAEYANDRRKYLFFEHVRSEAKRIDAVASLTMQDAWELEAFDIDEYRRVIEETGPLSVSEAERRGLGKKVEAVVVFAEAPDMFVQAVQRYERLGAEGRHIMLGAKRENEEGFFTGACTVFHYMTPVELDAAMSAMRARPS